MSVFLTDAQLTNSVAARLKRVSIDISNSSYWPQIITDANNWAYNEIVRKLAERGFSITQINAWQQGAEFNSKLGMYWAIVDGGVGDAFDDKMLERLDCRKELETVNVFDLTTNPTSPIVYPQNDIVITTGSTNEARDASPLQCADGQTLAGTCCGCGNNSCGGGCNWNAGVSTDGGNGGCC